MPGIYLYYAKNPCDRLFHFFQPLMLGENACQFVYLSLTEKFSLSLDDQVF
ncbi:Uncharacterized protein dnm_010380 [Desulfonema magnum]|uniref:Uncharacterized protein n=1 Tax=Desulfonema magnum TaxID=45655 RepID=A0A975GKW6_9BACT|nr:Uncharacterized protein dnm_010380 [Desulfonema magnum]